MKGLSIIVPCYNEAKTLPKVLQKLVDLKLENWTKELVLVDDGSKDDTPTIIKNFKNNHPEITKIHLITQNGGKGSTVKEGLKIATGDFILIQDADLEYDPGDIEKLLKAIDQPKTIILGSRNLLKETQKGKFIPRLGVKTITLLINFLYDQNLTDVWTGYKLFPQETNSMFVGGKFESEIIFLLKTLHQQYKIKETPISYNPRTTAEGKKIRYRDGFKTILVILKTYFEQKLTNRKNIV